MGQHKCHEVEQRETTSPGPGEEQRCTTKLLESSWLEKDLGVLVNACPTMTQPCALVEKKANSTLVCVRHIISS